MPSTWNPSDLLNITLSGGNLIAVGNATAGATRSTFNAVSGKWYWEYTATLWGAGTTVGIANSGVTLNNVNIFSNNAATVNKAGTISVNNVNTGISLGASVDGGLICVALDLGAKLIWFRRTASGNWNGNVANDPGTGVGGVNIAAITATTLPAFALVAMATGTAGNVTANFGGSAFSGSPSSGYANGIGVGATFPNAWNLNDKTSNVTLSGGNVIGTATGSPQGGARGLYSQTTGKYYWECVCNTITGIGTAVGATISGYAFTIAPNSAGVPGMVALTQAGNIRTSGGNAPGVAFGTITSGTLVGIAYDIGAALIWFRLGAAGNWNANVANNPTTGVGGVSTTGMGAGVAAFPTMWTQATSDQITGNFGAAAFTGTAPAGFTGGFSGDLPVSGARVQAMVMA